MIEVFHTDIVGRKVKCPDCGKEMLKGTKQLKVFTGMTRYGINSSYICPLCAQDYMQQLQKVLNNLTRSL